jgi:hypothetical protein
MIRVSLAVNLIVLIPVLLSLWHGAGDAAFGVDTPARRVLISVYAAIALVSAAALAMPADLRLALVPGLLVVQIVYKLITVPMLGPANPIVLTNLAVVAVHAVTLWTLRP